MAEVFAFGQHHRDEGCDPEPTQQDLASGSEKEVPVHVSQAAVVHDATCVGLNPHKVEEGHEKEQAQCSADHCSGSVDDFVMAVWSIDSLPSVNAG